MYWDYKWAAVIYFWFYFHGPCNTGHSLWLYFLKDSRDFKVLGIHEKIITENILIIHTLRVWNKMKIVKYHWIKTG